MKDKKITWGEDGESIDFASEEDCQKMMMLMKSWKDACKDARREGRKIQRVIDAGVIKEMRDSKWETTSHWKDVVIKNVLNQAYHAIMRSRK